MRNGRGKLWDSCLTSMFHNVCIANMILLRHCQSSSPYNPVQLLVPQVIFQILGRGLTKMPTHWHPSSCFGRYSSGKRTKWMCPSNELHLIWHYGISLTSSRHVHLSVAQSVGLVSGGNLKRMNQLMEMTEVKHMNLFLSNWWVFQGAFRGNTRKKQG